MSMHSSPALPSRVFRSIGVIVILAIVIMALAACQSSGTDDSVTSAVNQANQAAQNAATGSSVRGRCRGEGGHGCPGQRGDDRS